MAGNQKEGTSTRKAETILSLLKGGGWIGRGWQIMIEMNALEWSRNPEFEKQIVEALAKYVREKTPNDRETIVGILEEKKWPTLAQGLRAALVPVAAPELVAASSPSPEPDYSEILKPIADILKMGEHAAGWGSKISNLDLSGELEKPGARKALVTMIAESCSGWSAKGKSSVRETLENWDLHSLAEEVGEAFPVTMIPPRSQFVEAGGIVPMNFTNGRYPDLKLQPSNRALLQAAMESCGSGIGGELIKALVTLKDRGVFEDESARREAFKMMGILANRICPSDPVIKNSIRNAGLEHFISEYREIHSFHGASPSPRRPWEKYDDMLQARREQEKHRALYPGLCLN